MRLLVFALLASGLVFCGSGPHPTVETVYVETHVEGAEDRSTATMSVQGMMCEVGCVAKVRKELLEVKGVASAMIDFEKDRELNFATIEFDADAVSAAELVAKVVAIGDGMYPVPQMEVTHVGAGRPHP